MEKGLRKKGYKQWLSMGIVCLLAVTSFGIGQLYSVEYSFAAVSLGELNQKGDSITKTQTNGQDWTFTSKVDGSYLIELYGSAGAGVNAGRGGLVSATVELKKGERIQVFLGAQAPVLDGTRDAKKGTSGSGYGDNGVYKATVSMGSNVILTAGGGGVQGNPGTGNRERNDSRPVDRRDHDVTPCRLCGYVGARYDREAFHTYYYGTGGKGGNGANGGSASIVNGANGEAG